GQAGVGGSPIPPGSGVPVSALVSYGRGIEAETAGDRAAARTAFQAALREAPGFTQAGAALQRVGG
ncbi:MAG TPA: hypothetical protein PLL69_08450, partial [Gemmatimonadales bacterium]|nr:hypothetical protein [Gemmatimonadales bacterium]